MYLHLCYDDQLCCNTCCNDVYVNIYLLFTRVTPCYVSLTRDPRRRRLYPFMNEAYPMQVKMWRISSLIHWRHELTALINIIKENKQAHVCIEGIIPQNFTQIHMNILLIFYSQLKWLTLCNIIKSFYMNWCILLFVLVLWGKPRSNNLKCKTWSLTPVLCASRKLLIPNWPY